MSLQSEVRAAFRSAAGYFGDATDYRQKTNGAWPVSWSTGATAEIKTFSTRQEMDPIKGTVLKKQRAVAKFYDTSTTDAPVLRMGDEVRRDGIVWCVDEVLPAESAAGVYRYALVRDIPLAAQADRGQLPIAEGGPSNEANTMANRFSAENVDSATIFKGAAVHRSLTGLVLASNDDADLAAVGMCLVETAIGDNATAVTGDIITLDDWTDVIGAADLTPGTLYYLGVDGQLTTTPPTAPAADISQRIGTAVTARALALEIEPAEAL